MHPASCCRILWFSAPWWSEFGTCVFLSNTIASRLPVSGGLEFFTTKFTTNKSSDSIELGANKYPKLNIAV